MRITHRSCRFVLVCVVGLAPGVAFAQNEAAPSAPTMQDALRL